MAENRFSQYKTVAPKQNRFSRFITPPMAEEGGPDIGPANSGSGRTMFDQGMQGATFGFADEASDRLGALGATLFDGGDIPYNDYLSSARAMSKRDLTAQQNEHPVLAPASQIAGGLATAVATSLPRTLTAASETPNILRQGVNLIPKAGSKITDFLGKGSFLAKTGKAAISGGASGALYGAGTAEEGKRGAGAARGGITGTLTGATVPAISEAAGVVVKPAIRAITGKAATIKPNLTNVNPDETFAAAVEPVQKQFEEGKKLEGELWDAARSNATNTTVKSDVMNSFSSSIDNALKEEGLSLSDDSLKPLRERVSKLETLSEKPVIYEGAKGKKFYGEAPPDAGRPINDLIAARRSISLMAAKNPDGNVRHAAGVALRAFDDHLENNLGEAILKGDDAAIEKFKKAIDFSRKQFQDFGTNRKAGQSPLFERLITKSELDNAQFADAFGVTARGKEGTSQLYSRLLQNAGPNRETVRKNLAKGMVERAIRKSTKEIEGGEEIVMPDRFRTELTRIIDESRSAGGAGKMIRDEIYTKEELQSLIKLRNGIKDPRNFWGAMRQLGVKIPLGSTMITKPQIAAGRATRRQVEDYLSGAAKAVRPELRGKAISYGALLAGQQVGDQTGVQ